MRIVCVNAGSSSLKMAVFDDEDPVLTGAVERIGASGAEISVRRAGADAIREPGVVPDHATAVVQLLDRIGPMEVDAVGHRFVHGGESFSAPVRIDDGVVAELRTLSVLAPMHTPPALAVLSAMRERHPERVHVACFDTAFHRTIPDVARRIPLPDAIVAEGVHRYGFHGLSYEWITSALAPLPPRVVALHLGNGASLAALRDGRSIDTTMGFTPTGGIPMGTRSGDLDPGVLLWLLREGRGVDEVAEIVERRSGLVALGGTSDMRALVARSDDTAKLAVRTFAYHVKKAVGAFVAVLGGLDALVFTVGIGERSPDIRALVCEGLEPMGIVLDPEANQRGEDVVSDRRSRAAVRIVRADEDRVIARHVRSLVVKP